MTLAERIRFVREKYGDSQTKFAEKIKISRSAVSKIESGENTPSNQTITLICKEYHTNYLWLTEEKGEQESDNSDAQAIVDSVMKGDNEFAKSVLVKFAKLSEDHWKQIENILNELENN